MKKNTVKNQIIATVICGGLFIGFSGSVIASGLNQPINEAPQQSTQTDEDWYNTYKNTDAAERDKFAKEVSLFVVRYARTQPSRTAFLPQWGITENNGNGSLLKGAIFQSNKIMALGVTTDAAELQAIKRSLTEMLPVVGYQPLYQDFSNVIGLIDYAVENKDDKALVDVDRILSDLFWYFADVNYREKENHEYYGVTNTLENKSTFTSDYQPQEVNAQYDYEYLKEKIEKEGYIKPVPRGVTIPGNAIPASEMEIPTKKGN